MDQKSVQKGPKMDSWGQAGPFFPENAKKQPFVPVFDNYYANDQIL